MCNKQNNSYLFASYFIHSLHNDLFLLITLALMQFFFCLKNKIFVRFLPVLVSFCMYHWLIDSEFFFYYGVWFNDIEYLVQIY